MITKRIKGKKKLMEMIMIQLSIKCTFSIEGLFFFPFILFVIYSSKNDRPLYEVCALVVNICAGLK